MLTTSLVIHEGPASAMEHQLRRQYLALAVQQRPNLRRGALLHVGQDVCVDLHRHAHLCVTEALADDMDRLTGLQQECGARMPQTMELDRLYERAGMTPPTYT